MSLAKKIGAGYVLAVVLLIAVSAAAVYATLQQRHTAAHAMRTTEVLRHLEATGSAVKDAQRAERGFILTGEDHYLAPFFDAGHTLRTSFAALRTSMSETEAPLLDTLQTRIDSLLVDFDAMIQLRRDRGFWASRRVVQRGSGSASRTDAVLALIEQMKRAEGERLAAVSGEAEREARNALFIIVAGVLIALCITSVAGVALVRDVRARQHAEHALRQSQRRFATAFNATPIAGAITSLATGRLLDVNESFLRLTGLKRDEVLGLGADEVGRLTGLSGRSDLLRRLEQDGRYQDVELQIHTRTGAVLDILSFAEIIQVGNEPCVHVFMHDITGRKQSEARIRRMNEDLEGRVRERTAELAEKNGALQQEIREREKIEEALRRSEQALAAANEDLERRVAERTAELSRANVMLTRRNRELQDFAYVASHDLQEPLRKISSFVDLLREACYTRLGEEERFYFQRIQGSAIRMTTLLRDLLSFSRIATRGEPFRTLDLNAIAADVLADLDLTIVEAGGRVEVAPLPEIDGDPVQMRQLLLNLLANALKFRRDGTPPHVRIRACLEPAGADAAARCCIEVQDNGIGFEEKYLDRIFSPFQRLHTKDAYPGTGMGLAICRRIVERHDGTITATSRPGEGSTFVVRLPVRQPCGDTRSAAA